MYCCKILEIINELMNFFLNHGLISLNTVSTPQNIFLMIIEKHILIIWNMLYESSSNSASVQVIHQQIRGGGVKTWADLNDIGGPKFGETGWHDAWPLCGPYPLWPLPLCSRYSLWSIPFVVCTLCGPYPLLSVSFFFYKFPPRNLLWMSITQNHASLSCPEQIRPCLFSFYFETQI